MNDKLRILILEDVAADADRRCAEDHPADLGGGAGPPAIRALLPAPTHTTRSAAHP